MSEITTAEHLGLLHNIKKFPFKKYEMKKKNRKFLGSLITEDGK